MGLDRIGEIGDRASEGQAAGVYGAGFTAGSLASFHVFVFVHTFVCRSFHFLVGFPFLFLFIELSVLWYFTFHVVSFISFLSQELIFSCFDGSAWRQKCTKS